MLMPEKITHENGLLDCTMFLDYTEVQSLDKR